MLPWRTVETSTAKNTMLKNSTAARDAVDDRDRREDDGDGAAEAGPADQRAFRRRVLLERRRERGRDRPRDAGHDQPEQRALDEDITELAREDQQPERQEHPDLGDGREAGVERADRLARRDDRVCRARGRPGRRRGSRSRRWSPLLHTRPRRSRPRQTSSRPDGGALQPAEHRDRSDADAAPTTAPMQSSRTKKTAVERPVAGRLDRARRAQRPGGPRPGR